MPSSDRYAEIEASASELAAGVLSAMGGASKTYPGEVRNDEDDDGCGTFGHYCSGKKFECEAGEFDCGASKFGCNEFTG
jgi:hypothetical protein